MKEKTKKIKQLVDLHFEDIPYSVESEEARKRIEATLQKAPESEDVDKLISEYGTIDKMGIAAGYTEEDISTWRNPEKVEVFKTVKNGLRRQRWLAYAFSFAVAALFRVLLWLVYYSIIGSTKVFPLIGYFVGLGGIGAFALYLFIRYEKTHKGGKYDAETYHWLRDRSDKYAKRLLNSIALIFAVVAIFIGSELTFFFSGNSKGAELVENMFTNLIWVLVPIFLVAKNILMVNLYQNRINVPKQREYKFHAIIIAGASAVYWLVVMLITILLREKIAYLVNAYIISGIVFGLLLLIYNYTFRKRVTQQNFVINKTRIAVALVISILVSGFAMMNRETYYTQPYINSLPVVEHNVNKIEYDDATGTYTITATNDDFKVLHLTDIHLGGSLFSYRKDIKALSACYDLIEHTHPDFVIVTGDLSFPLGIFSMSFNNSAPVYQFASFMRNLDIPWAFTYGNHDTESFASMNKTALNEVYKSLSYKTSHTLLYPYIQPEIMGRNNQMIKLKNSDGTLNTAFFLIDSNAYTGEGINVYDYIHDDQVEWYATKVGELNAEAGHTVNSLAFFHIPLQQYRTAYELYVAESDAVTYYFGENNETMLDKVCCSDYPSEFFDTALELGSTTGMFCGHDHYNNMSLEYKGIRLTYGMSIDYLAMPGIENDLEQRGAELITIHKDSSWDLVQIPLESIRK